MGKECEDIEGLGIPRNCGLSGGKSPAGTAAQKACHGPFSGDLGESNHERRRTGFQAGATFKGWGWADAPEDAPYVVRKPCVAVQRTSRRGQKHRLNAAAIPSDFIAEHGGVIGENHVILLIPNRSDAMPPEILAEALNRPAASAELDRVCGSASISVRLLESIRLAKLGT